MLGENDHCSQAVGQPRSGARLSASATSKWALGRLWALTACALVVLLPGCIGEFATEKELDERLDALAAADAKPDVGDVPDTSADVVAGTDTFGTTDAGGSDGEAKTDATSPTDVVAATDAVDAADDATDAVDGSGDATPTEDAVRGPGDALQRRGRQLRRQDRRRVVQRQQHLHHGLLQSG
jgi:hypothetical protein